MKKRRLLSTVVAICLCTALLAPAWADFRAGMRAYRNKDYTTAMQEFKADGRAEAKYNIGTMYYKGEGVKQNKKEAAEWLRKAAEEGFARAQFALSAMNFSGDGIEQNIPEGVKWMRKAAEKGFAEAQFRLGMMYINGDNVEKNRETGVMWVKKAARQGHVNAKKLRTVRGEK